MLYDTARNDNSTYVDKSSFMPIEMVIKSCSMEIAGGKNLRKHKDVHTHNILKKSIFYNVCCKEFYTVVLKKFPRFSVFTKEK